MRIILILVILFSVNAFGQNTSVKNFGDAKSILVKVYGNKNRTFYCQCLYQKKTIESKDCKLNLTKFKQRKKRLEWEHIVPAHAFGQSFKEWRDAKAVCPSIPSKKSKPKKISSRKCAATKNKNFRLMEADIYNLVPSVGALNALRSNYSMAKLDRSGPNICPGVVINNNKFMPSDKQKGDVARIYLYMDQAYPGHGIISSKNAKLFEAWDKLDPVDREECELIREKEKFQKNKNLIVLERCKKLSL